MEIILRSEPGLFDVVNGITKQPATDAAGYAAWNILNSKGMLLISSGMEYDQLQTVINCQPEMWHKLKTIHEQRSVINKLQLKQQYFNYRMLETDSIAKHLNKIDTMAQALTEVGEPVIEVDKIAKALGSLSLKYNNFIKPSSEEAKQTYDNLTSRLLKEEQRFTQTEEATTAFVSLTVSKTIQHNQA